MVARSHLESKRNELVSILSRRRRFIRERSRNQNRYTIRSTSWLNVDLKAYRTNIRVNQKLDRSPHSPHFDAGIAKSAPSCTLDEELAKDKLRRL